MKCPICRTEFTPSGFGMHVKKHVAAGELVRIEKIQAKKVTTYAWSGAGTYVKPKRAK